MRKQGRRPGAGVPAPGSLVPEAPRPAAAVESGHPAWVGLLDVVPILWAALVGGTYVALAALPVNVDTNRVESPLTALDTWALGLLAAVIAAAIIGRWVSAPRRAADPCPGIPDRNNA